MLTTIKRHRTFEFDIVYYETYLGEGNPGNAPVDLTGWSVRSQIREKRKTRRNKDALVIANLNAVIPVPASGGVRVVHTREFTSSLVDRPGTEIEWDIVLTDPDGNDVDLLPAEPIEIITPPTNPDDGSSFDFIPGGGGAVHHVHPISHITGLQAILDDFESRISALEP